jgi:Molecular chaperone
VLLIGGPLKIPKFQSHIKSLFPLAECPGTTSINPDEILAAGAARQAGFLVDIFSDFQKHLPEPNTDVFVIGNDISVEVRDYTTFYGVAGFLVDIFSEILAVGAARQAEFLGHIFSNFQEHLPEPNTDVFVIGNDISVEVSFILFWFSLVDFIGFNIIYFTLFVAPFAGFRCEL